MSISLHVVGYRPADDQWDKMKAIWEACQDADVAVPEEVDEFFDGEDPGDKPGAEVSLEKAVTEWHDDYRSGYEIDLTKLPPNVTVLRAYLS